MPITADDISEIAKKDENRLIGVVAKALAQNAAYINSLRGGTFSSGISDTVQVVMQLPAAPGDAQAIPTFTPYTQIAGSTGSLELTDSVNLSYQLESKRGLGPKVNVQQGYAAFKTSYTAAADSLVKLITQYINADVRGQLFLKSASKFTVANDNFNNLFKGGTEADLGVKFATGVLPTGPLTHRTVHRIVRYVKEALLGDFFPGSGEGMPHARFYAEEELIERFRVETSAQAHALAAGSYQLGKQMITGYHFDNNPAYRGIATAVDHSALRATGFDGNGNLILVNPRLVVTDEVKNTAYSVINPAWQNAPYGVATLMFDNAFVRETPEQYTGEGDFKFAPQLWSGTLQWVHRPDNDENLHSDFGRHIYQITRAYRPVRPQHVVQILYKRCLEDFDFGPCSEDES